MTAHTVECHHALLHLTCLHCLWSLPVSLKESWQLFVLSTPVLTLLSCNRPRSLPVSLKESWQLFVLSAPAPLNGAGAGTLPFLCVLANMQRTIEVRVLPILPWPACCNLSLLLNAASPPTNSELAVDTIWTTNKFIQHSAALCKTKLIALGFGPAECASPHLTSPSDALTKQQHNPNIVSQQYTNRPAECAERLNGH